MKKLITSIIALLFVVGIAFAASDPAAGGGGSRVPAVGAGTAEEQFLATIPAEVRERAAKLTGAENAIELLRGAAERAAQPQPGTSASF